MRIAQLKYKEVISIADGSRFGYIGDLELDLESGQVRALVVPGRRRLFGLLGREEDMYIPWGSVRRFGEDIILVEQEPRPLSPHRRKDVCLTGSRGYRWRRTTGPSAAPAGPEWRTGPGHRPPAGGGTPLPGSSRPRAGCGHF